ncbi:MAG: DUF4209 domain-containing protein [Phycisphaerae bacterium]|nr:DUF4209 domain-containing protein [Phycisphaerae bacterium]
MPVEPLDRVLMQFDNRTDPFDEIEIADTIQDLARKRGNVDELEFRELAEGIAFSFAETDTNEPSRWGTYYGPRNSMTTKSGETIESPRIERVTPEMLAYWKERVKEATHPRLRVRYADLAYDFGEHVTGEKPDYHLAHIVIDETLRMVDQQAYEHVIEVHCKLKRALDLAIRLNDKPRIEQVCSAVIAFEDQTAEDNALGTWGFAFDLLIEGGCNCTLTGEQETHIINSLENHLKRAASGGPPKFDPFATESAALRLARYYRSKKQDVDLLRVLGVYVDSWIRRSGESNPSLGSLWLEKARGVLHDFGLHDEAEQLESRVRELAGRSREDMATIRHSVQFTNEEINAFLDAMTAGTLGQTLVRIALQFLPDPEKTKAEVLKVAEQFPLFSVFTKRIIDHSGRVVAEVGAPQDDLEGQIAHRMAEDLGFCMPFLRATIDKVCDKFSMSTDAVLDFLFQSPAFEEDRRPLIQMGVEAYLRGDHAVSAHMLVPQIEAAVRNLVVGLGGPILERGRHGGMNLRNLGKLLRDERLVATLTDRVTLYLRVLLTDQRGWNLRNIVCHGLAPAGAFGSAVADRILHALLLLGLTKERSPEHENAQGVD